MFHHMTLQEAAGNTSPSDEPVIANPVIWYSHSENVIAIVRALGTKAEKGRAYSSDLLVLHTLPKPGVVDLAGIGMNADELVLLGQAFLNTMPELARRFREIWFLNRYTTNGKRLYRLAT